ncbi:hypothetical protein J6590_074949 [Homalodisca vitripennis]|nr:hypothetical protein J6590_074949 [Homalodisca vitripennis]
MSRLLKYHESFSTNLNALVLTAQMMRYSLKYHGLSLTQALSYSQQPKWLRCSLMYHGPSLTQALSYSQQPKWLRCSLMYHGPSLTQALSYSQQPKWLRCSLKFHIPSPTQALSYSQQPKWLRCSLKFHRPSPTQALSYSQQPKWLRCSLMSHGPSPTQAFSHHLLLDPTPIPPSVQVNATFIPLVSYSINDFVVARFIRKRAIWKLFHLEQKHVTIALCQPPPPTRARPRRVVELPTLLSSSLATSLFKTRAVRDKDSPDNCLHFKLTRRPPTLLSAVLNELNVDELLRSAVVYEDTNCWMRVLMTCYGLIYPHLNYGLVLWGACANNQFLRSFKEALKSVQLLTLPSLYNLETTLFCVSKCAMTND